MAEFDAKFKAFGTDLTPKAPEPAKDDAAPAAPKPEPAAPPKPSTPPPEPARTPKELRAELDRTKSELTANSAAKAGLEAKIRDFEAKGKDTEALVARLEARDKEFERLQGELRALKQEASPEFKAKYDKPFDQAAAYAKRVLTGVMKVDGTPADFDKDFVPLYRLAHDSSPIVAENQAKEVFGDSAGAIMRHVEKLVELDYVRQEAFEEEKKGWAEKAKQEEGQRVQRQESWKKNQAAVEKDLQDSIESYRDPVDDKELQQQRAEGYQLWDMKVNTPEEAHRKAAHVKHRFAAFGPNQLTIRRQAKRIADLEAQIAGLKPKQPGENTQKPGGTETAAPAESWEEGARKAITA